MYTNPFSTNRSTYERFFAYYQPQELRDLLQNAGFVVLDTGINVTPRVNWIWFLCKKPLTYA